MTEKQYPKLPEPEQATDDWSVGGVIVEYFTGDQMRAFADATCAMRATKAAPQPAENFWAQVDAMRSELAADIREVFDANGPETPQIVRDVIEYADSWLQVAIQRESKRSARTQPAAPASQDAEDAARYRWLRARWGRMADEYDGESDQLVAIRESDSSFEGWDVDPVSLDRAIDAARAAKEGGEA